ncbi:hypothetical protein [Streptomyces sp. NPDC001296]
MDTNDPQDVGAAFWAQILGVTISEEPPPPDSPLGRVRAFTAEHGEEALSDEHFEAAMEGRPLPMTAR